ncbi:carbon starvation protein A [bacterium]
MLTILFILCFIILFIGYKVYGRFLANTFDLNVLRPTPAMVLNDNKDYVPSHILMIFGHHFSSIAGAGPIIGPILAATLFGWLPAMLWILIGSIFIGGMHDFTALIASVRHKGKSIAEIAKNTLGKEAYLSLLIFMLLSLIYILIVFLDLTASTFVNNGSVATSSIFYIILALCLGIILKNTKKSLLIYSVPFVILLFIFIIIAQKIPLSSFSLFGLTPKETWQVILVFYCFLASILPVWILLQPRDYLSSYLLYFAVIVGLIGILFSSKSIQFPHFIPALQRFHNIGSIFPVLFITVACGAVSGFHSLVSSGTTSKQIHKETDTLTVGYGGMIVEAVVALIALATVMLITRANAQALGNPLAIFSHGIGSFLNLAGIPQTLGKSMGLLIISTFVLTTLDTATRISRYIIQELFDWTSKKQIILAAIIALAGPFISIFIKTHDPKTGALIPIWRIIWPVFGTTNQLLAAITLIVIFAWAKTLKIKNRAFILIPAIFMYIITLYSLTLLILNNPLIIIKITSILLLLLASHLVYVCFKAK